MIRNSKPTQTKKPVKPEPPVTLTKGVPGKAPISTHKVYKNIGGDVMITHTGRDSDTKVQKYNMTKKKGITSVNEGVSAFKKHHSRKSG